MNHLWSLDLLSFLKQIEQGGDRMKLLRILRENEIPFSKYSPCAGMA